MDEDKEEKRVKQRSGEGGDMCVEEGKKKKMIQKVKSMDEKKRKKLIIFFFFYKKLWSHLAVKEKERNGGKNTKDKNER